MSGSWVMFGFSHFFGDIFDLIADSGGRLAYIVENVPEIPVTGRPGLKERLDRLPYKADLVRLDLWSPVPGDRYVMGFAQAKMKPLLESLQARFGIRFPPLIHSRAIRQAGSLVGDGTMLGAGAILGPWAKVGRHVILNRGSNVGHDCQIGDFSFLSPSAVLCGHVKLGEGVFVGANATLLPDVSVGSGAVIAAGAVVTEDVLEGTMVAGVPAQVKGKARP